MRIKKNLLDEKYREIWDVNKNLEIGLKFEEVTTGSHKKAWWLCSKHGEYQQIIKNKTNGDGCQYCSGRKVHLLTCLETIYPDIAKLWHLTLNGNLTPRDVLPKSGKKVWWNCPIHGEYKQEIRLKTNGSGCPYCSGRYATPDTCLEVTHPNVAKQWHPTLNGNLTPKDVLAKSAKKVWWVCPVHGAYKQSLENKSKGCDCPYCAGKKAHFSTCLETIHPDIAKLWHPTLNGKLTAKDVLPNSNKKVWWICETHGAYKQQVYKKTSRKDGCPLCGESKGEKTISTYLKENKINFNVQHTFDDCRDKSLLLFDFGVLDHHKKLYLLIEYDGELHYKAVEYFSGMKGLKAQQRRDRIKDNYCRQNRIPLLRIPYWNLDNIENILNEVLISSNKLSKDEFYFYITNKTEELSCNEKVKAS